RVAALLGAAFVTMGSDYLRHLPARGLRDDLFITMSAAFVLLTIVCLQIDSKWRWVYVAAAGVACMWTRSPTLLFAAIFFAWLVVEGFIYRSRLDALGWVRPWRMWEAALCLVVIYA